jgi:hypothetical protein
VNKVEVGLVGSRFKNRMLRNKHRDKWVGMGMWVC